LSAYADSDVRLLQAYYFIRCNRVTHLALAIRQLLALKNNTLDEENSLQLLQQRWEGEGGTLYLVTQAAVHNVQQLCGLRTYVRLDWGGTVVLIGRRSAVG
jgi:hypothetical protein